MVSPHGKVRGAASGFWRDVGGWGRLVLQRGLPLLLLLRGDAEEASLCLHALRVSSHCESSKERWVVWLG